MRIHQKGQAFVLVIIILGLVVINSLVIINNSITFDQGTHFASDRLAATGLAEAGIDKAIASLNATGGSYIGETATTLSAGQFDVTTASELYDNNLIITATGYVPSKAKPRISKQIKIRVAKGLGTAFFYALQIDTGGLVMGGGSKIQGVAGAVGSVYSNGNISVTGANASITGDAYVSGGVATTPQISLDCTSSCANIYVGKEYPLFDPAQSFTPTTTGYLRKVSLKLSKVGKPPNIKIYLLGDSGGLPNKNSVLSSGTLNASLVVSTFGFVDVGFDPPPNLTSGTKYWIVMETSTYAPDINNYWFVQPFLNDTYTGGVSKASPKWNDTNPVWNDPLLFSGDLSLKTYMAGTVTSLQGSGSSTKLTVGDANCANGKSSAHANTLAYLNIEGDWYYNSSATSITTTCGGVAHSGQVDPAYKPMPISDGDIDYLKQAATDAGSTAIPGGTLTTCPTNTLGKGKYKGSVDLSGATGCNVIFVSSPVWFTGHFYLGSGNTLKLDPAMGNQSGFLLVGGCTGGLLACGAPDANAGKIDIGNNNIISGDGQANSYLLLISNFDSTGGASDAIAVNNNLTATKAVLYSNKGNINLKNNNTITAIYGWKVNLGNNVVVAYEQGLANTFLSTSPGGRFTFIKGTYQQK